ncbi:hypothetical protein AAFC00_004335 [Neodothiora populina]|uniref:UBC core domain-containing protein n=1 Tax=Neodothiora populina TaxID=2781224 RepID=A0ABR3PJM2_9PEZI
MVVKRSFHVDDVVAFKTGETVDAVGYIDRTHADVESHDPLPGESYGMKIHRSKSLSREAYKQFMRDGIPPKGFVLVQWQTHPKTELVAEKLLELLDRAFLVGDIVKRDDDDETMAGTVVSVRKNCTLLPMCEAKELKSGKSLRAAWLPSPLDDEPPLLELVNEGSVLQDIPASELKLVHEYNQGDLVIYKNWFGRIRECFDEITVRLSDNGVVTLKTELDVEPLNGDPGERLSVGSLIKTKKGSLRTGIWRFGAYNPNVTPVGVVVDVKTQECQVDWLQPKITKALLSEEDVLAHTHTMPEVVIAQDELESGNVCIYDLTRHPQALDTSPTKITSDPELQGGIRVRFGDVAGASVKYDGSTAHGKLERVDRRDTLGYDMNVFTVMNTLTKVDVQWTDLTITTELATTLVPDFAVDDEDAVFPGDIVCTNDHKLDDLHSTIRPSQVGVVQQVNNIDRIARVKWSTNHTLSFLETTYATHLPESVVGKLQEESEEVSFYDITAPECINRRRGDFVHVPESMLPDVELIGITWLGEIVDVTPQGRACIRLGAAEPVKEIEIPTESTILALRSADLDDVGGDYSDMEGDAMSLSSDDLDELDGENYDMDDDVGQWFVAGQPGMPVDDEDDSWSTASENEDENAGNEDMDMGSDEPMNSAPSNDTSAPLKTATAAVLPLIATATTTPPKATVEEMNISSFPGSPMVYEILDSPVPANHPIATLTTGANTAKLKSIQKEHKILRSPNALPPGIFVRTWESRLDLIRVLFIGPVGTPYEYAPFIVDLYLSPTFPSEPPKAHFHSWTSEGTGMQGRVNPNLYEDGKICLSLLGTWSGDDAKGEGWVSGKSTILQLLVSILGLVLVKEPYYNEAGYEPLQGLSSSRHSSSVYTERTYLRARAFLISPLSSLIRAKGHSETANLPPGVKGFEDVLRWLYVAASGPTLLDKAIVSAKTILINSDVAGVEKDGLSAVSKGAALLLKRVLGRLEALKQQSSTG